MPGGKGGGRRIGSAAKVRGREVGWGLGSERAFGIGGAGVTIVVATQEIEELADRISRTFHPERIVLFGSHAYGHAGRDSDVDLLVVMSYVGKSWEIATEIRNRTRPTFPLDLLVRSAAQMRERMAMGDPFVREISQRGKVLYEDHHR